MAEKPAPPEIQRRMKRYLVFRVLVTVLGFLLVTFYLACLPAETRGATAFYLYGLLAVYFSFALLSLLTFGHWRFQSGFYRRQVPIDFGFQAMLIWSTGGVVSIFSPVLFVTLAAATAVASARGAFIMATLGTLLLAGTTLAFSLGLIPPTSTWSAWIFSDENSVFIASYLLASVFGLYVISSLGSRLSYGLRHAEHFQEEIIENMIEGLLAIDRDGKLLHLNGEARKLLGLSGPADSYRHRPLKDIVRQSGEDAGKRLLDAFSAGQRKSFELNLVDAQGMLRPVEVKVSSIVDEKDRLRCLVALLTDRTLEKEVKAFEQRIQKLEELQLMAMGIAHEIRNPLASVRGCVQEIAKLSAGSPKQAEYSAIVMRESDRLDRIIEDFLRYARSGPVDLVPVNLVEVVDEAVMLVRQRSDLGARRVEWEPSPGDLQVYGDRDRLLQVFLNLGINALEATPEEEGEIRFALEERDFVKPRHRRWGGEEEERVPGVEVMVSDNGRGLSGTEALKVFTPFFTTKDKGTGLGLSIVDRIIREHMGTIDIRTEVGEGTRMCVRLPRLGSRQETVRDDRVSVTDPVDELDCHV